MAGKTPSGRITVPRAVAPGGQLGGAFRPRRARLRWILRSL